MDRIITFQDEASKLLFSFLRRATELKSMDLSKFKYRKATEKINTFTEVIKMIKANREAEEVIAGREQEKEDSIPRPGDSTTIPC